MGPAEGAADQIGQRHECLCKDTCSRRKLHIFSVGHEGKSSLDTHQTKKINIGWNLSGIDLVEKVGERTRKRRAAAVLIYCGS